MVPTVPFREAENVTRALKKRKKAKNLWPKSL